MTIEYSHFPNFARDRKKILKQFPKALEDLSRLELEIQGTSLHQVAYPIRNKPQDFPEIWKFYVPVRSANLEASKGLRLLVEKRGEVLHAMALYTHREYENQPDWKEMRRWMKEERRDTLDSGSE